MTCGVTEELMPSRCRLRRSSVKRWMPLVGKSRRCDRRERPPGVAGVLPGGWGEVGEARRETGSDQGHAMEAFTAHVTVAVDDHRRVEVTRSPARTAVDHDVVVSHQLILGMSEMRSLR